MPTVETVKGLEVRPWDMLDEGVFVREVEISMGVTAFVGRCEFICSDYDGQCLVGPEWSDGECRSLGAKVTVVRGLPARVVGCQHLKGCVRP